MRIGGIPFGAASLLANVKPPWAYLAATLFLAGILHIAAVLSLPHLATRNAWARLLPFDGVNTLVVLPAAAPGRMALPFMAPDVRYAFCRYDLSQGPVRLSTQVLDALWMIAFYTPSGDNYYAISGGDIRRERIEVVISTQAETLLELEVEATEDSENVILVRAPQESGIAMIRAPLRGAGYVDQTEQALQQASCATRLASPLVESPSQPRPDATPGMPPLPRRPFQ